MNFADIYTRWRSSSTLSKYESKVAKMANLETELASLSNEAIKARFQALKGVEVEARFIEGFALVREASRRTLGLRQFDVQLVGGLVLCAGKLAEMRTGEGKTLTIAAPAAVLALEGKGVHVVTANDYLAARDAELMRPVYEFLGLTVMSINGGQSTEQKQIAYNCDITYGVGHEYGFDYLRDNMVRNAAHRVQRDLYAAIVDEVDSILIDEARVPMIMSGNDADTAETTHVLNQIVKSLQPGKDYLVKLKDMEASLTEDGYAKSEAALAKQGIIDKESSLYAAKNLWVVKKLHSAVKAYALYKKDRDYVVEAGELVLVDVGSGRKMFGRRLGDGLHEALESKEGLQVKPGTVTKATVTYQNFFGLYQRLSGLTGTALTEADEFAEIYGLETVVVPTNKPIQRKVHEDLVFSTKKDKFSEVAKRVAELRRKSQPVLIGCATIRDAEVVSSLLTSEGVPHQLLTAKHIEKEAAIIAEAGAPGAVTVSTNMAGRGTDIMLGGEKPSKSLIEDEELYQKELAAWEAKRAKVLEAGGLYVLGTERNGIRRVDNQLAGRSGRQGDPGEVQFFMSLEDDLLKVFSNGKQFGLVRALLENAGGALGGKRIAALVTSSQKQFESQGFDARKNLMKYDKPLSDQRLAVYELRKSLLSGGATTFVENSVKDALDGWLARNIDLEMLPEQWDQAALKKGLMTEFGLTLPVLKWINKEELSGEEILQRIREAGASALSATVLTGSEIEEAVFSAIDDQWTSHLTALEELRQSAGLKANNGLNPLFQFSQDAYSLFKDFEFSLAMDIAARVLPTPIAEQKKEEKSKLAKERESSEKVVQELDKRWVLRNEPCPCGSGIRFKLCHGKLV